ncbi:MAG TPA: lycopene cyclase domain-containing protein [Pedobacter sp.]|nr:lycopene cyclase domain-containing protein [Pedobacter sp.]
MDKYTYLLIDFFTVIVPFLFSFHPKLQFHKTWRAFFPAVLITGIVFILWDLYFTDLGVWGFNPRYVCGLFIGNLPIEEILFFLCIPYACVFTFHCLNLFITRGMSLQIASVFTPVLIAVLVLTGIAGRAQVYTMTTFFGLAFLLLVAKYLLSIGWLGKFYVIYAVLLVPFLIVNGLLTGTGLEEPVVWYNNNEIFGLRILTIPVEDVFYGMALILMNLMIYKSLINRRFG